MARNKKIIIVTVFILLIISILYLLLNLVILFIFKPEKTSVSSPTVYPKSTEIMPSLTPTDFIKPTGQNIVISGIPVRNFFISPVKTNQSGDTVIIQNPRYSINYYPKFNQFLISITASPFPVVKKEAEEELLILLGIKKEDACMLDISVTTPNFANPDFAGKTYYLSFCRAK